MPEKVPGRAKGGNARAQSLTPERRSEIARAAANARHSSTIKTATHGSPDHPLRIGDIKIPCYVLEDGTRVLSQRGLHTAIGMSTSGGSGGAQRVAQFVASLERKGIDVNDLVVRTSAPVLFRPTGGGKPAYGYEATILTDICDAVLAARKAGKLLDQQERFAEQCELLTRGLARVGIIGLVDEATGYQKDRAKDALARILEDFVAKELQPYIPTFPADYYQELFRLRGLDFPAGSVRRPQYFGMLTNDIVYKRLAPGVLNELKRIKLEAGRSRDKLFQRLTSNVGYPKLREHLGSVVTIMKLSDGWHDFMGKINRLHPRYNETIQLPLSYHQESDDGKGL